MIIFKINLSLFTQSRKTFSNQVHFSKIVVTLFDQGGVNFSWSDPLNFSPRSLFKILASHFKDLRLSLFQGLVKTFHHRRDFSLALFSTIRFTFYQSSISRLIFYRSLNPYSHFQKLKIRYTHSFLLSNKNSLQKTPHSNFTSTPTTY